MGDLSLKSLIFFINLKKYKHFMVDFYCLNDCRELIDYWEELY